MTMGQPFSNLRCLKPVLVSAVLLAGVLVLFNGKRVWGVEGVEPVCSRGDILLCEDWETGQPWENGWGWNTNWSTASGVKCGEGWQGSCGLRLHFDQDDSDAIYPENGIQSIRAGQEVYARFMIKYSDPYQWNNPGSKVFYLRSDSGGAFSWAVQLGSRPKSSSDLRGPGKIYIDLQTHSLQLDYNKTPVYIIPGRWHSIEVMAIPNNQGMSNGTVKLWIDDTLVSDYSGLDMRKQAVNPSSEINSVWISAYIGGPTDPHPAQDIWYDNIVVSTKYIGPPGITSDTTPPGPPQRLRIL